MAIKVYREFYDPIEANIIKNKLLANDIPCFLTNENAAGLLWHMSIAHGGVQLMVHEENFDDANAILDQNPLDIDDNVQVMRCPYCNSGNISRGSGSKIKLSWLGIILSILLFAPAPFIKKQYHCFNCEKDFDKKP